MNGNLNIKNIQRKSDDFEYRSFNIRDIVDIIDMSTKEGSVFTAMNIQKRFMMFNDMQVSYSGGAPRPLLNLCITEYWNKLVDDAYQWDALFGIILYRVRLREIVTSETEMELPPEEIFEETVDEEGIRRITVWAPMTVSLDVITRARMFRKDDEIGVVVFDEANDMIDLNVKAYITRTPVWLTASFNSPCSCVLNQYRQSNLQTKLSLKSSIESVFTRLMFTANKEIPSKPGNPDLDLLSDSLIERIVHDPANSRSIARQRGEPPMSGQEKEEIERKRQQTSLNSMVFNYMKTGVLPDIGDSVYRVEPGYTASILPTGKFEGNVSQSSELFDQRVAGAFGVYIGFIRPSIGNRNTLGINEDHTQYLKDSVSTIAKTLSRFTKHVWCMDVYKQHTMHRLMVNIPISDKTALDEIMRMVESGFLSHEAGTTHALKMKHIEDKPGVRGKEPMDKNQQLPPKKKKKKKKQLPPKKTKPKKMKPKDSPKEKKRKRSASISSSSSSSSSGSSSSSDRPKATKQKKKKKMKTGGKTPKDNRPDPKQKGEKDNGKKNSNSVDNL